MPGKIELMTKEEKFVVKPLLKWFRRQDAKWELRVPKHGTSETGWDIEATRKNLDLLRSMSNE